jgi:hypothetical protein
MIVIVDFASHPRWAVGGAVGCHRNKAKRKRDATAENSHKGLLDIRIEQLVSPFGRSVIVFLKCDPNMKFS